MSPSPELLDDPDSLAARDLGGMLPAVASSAAQVREAAVLSAEAGLEALRGQDRPRAVVVLGMGGSGIAGDVLAAVAGYTCPVPVLTHRAHGLPTWVGAADLVIAVSCSGRTEETLSGLDEAVRRGCRLLVVGAPGSLLEALARRGRAQFVPVAPGRQPRASVWALSTPLIIAGDALGLLEAPAGVVAEAALLLEQIAVRCRPDADSVLNPAKSLAMTLAGQLPAVWGSSPLAGVAAHRLACQINENAATPAAYGVLPEVGHNQVVALDGPFSRGLQSEQDLFRDRAEDEEPGRTRLALVLLRDSEEHPRVALRAEVVRDLARERGVEVAELRAEGASSFERLASLIAVGDFASTYLALAQGTDPTPVEVITELKERIDR